MARDPRGEHNEQHFLHCRRGCCRRVCAQLRAALTVVAIATQDPNEHRNMQWTAWGRAVEAYSRPSNRRIKCRATMNM